MAWLLGAVAWLKERGLLIVGALLLIVAALGWMLRNEHLRRLAAEGRARLERIIADSAQRRRDRTDAARAKRAAAKEATEATRVEAHAAVDEERRKTDDAVAGDDVEGRLDEWMGEQ